MKTTDPQGSQANPPTRKIIDHTQLHQITERLFTRLPIHLIENNQKIEARAMAYTYPYLEVSHNLPPKPNRTLLLIKEDHSMLLECHVEKRTEHSTEILKPLRLTLTHRQVRHENRTNMLAGQVHNVIPHAEFIRANAATNASRDALVLKYTKAVQGLMPQAKVKIDFQRIERRTVRMRKLHEFNLPIFAPEISRQRNADEQSIVALPYTEYEQIIRADGLAGEVMGEICEPLRYRDVLILGFVQVLSEQATLTVQQYHSVRQLTRRLEHELDATHSFPENPITGKIIDVSRGGMGFLYTGQRSLLSSVGVQDHIVLEAHFAPDNTATFSGKIMNMTALETGKRYGIEFENVSEAGAKVLETFLAKK